MDITKWKLKYEKELKYKNEEIFQNNLDIVNNDIRINKLEKEELLYYLCKKTMHIESVYVPIIDDIFGKSEKYHGKNGFPDDYKNKIKQLYSLNIDDYLIH